jgi:hypothetical protein
LFHQYAMDLQARAIHHFGAAFSDLKASLLLPIETSPSMTGDIQPDSLMYSYNGQQEMHKYNVCNAFDI